MGEAYATERRLREAAARALVRNGYSQLSISDIGEELGQSTSLIYHYYEHKDDLLLAMLEEFTGSFLEHRVQGPIEDPAAELRRLIDVLMHPTEADIEGIMATQSVDVDRAWSRLYVELWTRATWDDAYRRKVAQVDRRLEDVLAQIIEAGIATGQFQPVDADETALHILSLLRQAIHTRATTNRPSVVHSIEAIIDDLVADLRTDA